MAETSVHNVIVVGGSYVGLAATKELAKLLPKSHRVLLIEPHSHFNHLFVFPRFAVLPSHEHKGFIPYTGTFAEIPDSERHIIVKARVTSVNGNSVVLDRAWQGSETIPFEYLVIATGTRLPAPGCMDSDEKLPSVEYLRKFQAGVQKAQSIVIIGGGAVGVQMATDIKEIYPNKEVTLVHSREHVMPLYDPQLHCIIKERFDELGVKLITGNRVVVPEGGFPTDTTPTNVQLKDGTTLSADLVIPATGQTPNTQLLSGLGDISSSGESLVNPANGFVRVKPTLQLQDQRYSHIFAVGDVADTGAHKAARPGAAQAAVVAKNIAAMIEGGEANEVIQISPPGIHLSLGLTKNVVFRNPNKNEGQTEPVIKWKDDGKADMGIEGAWARRGVNVKSPQEYHL